MRAVLLSLCVLVACDREEPEDTDTEPVDRVAEVMMLQGDSARGVAVFDAECLSCHSEEQATLFGSRPEENQVRAVLLGPGSMPAYDGVLTDQEIADVVAYMIALDGG